MVSNERKFDNVLENKKKETYFETCIIENLKEMGSFLIFEQEFLLIVWKMYSRDQISAQFKEDLKATPNYLSFETNLASVAQTVWK